MSTKKYAMLGIVVLVLLGFAYAAVYRAPEMQAPARTISPAAESIAPPAENTSLPADHIALERIRAACEKRFQNNQERIDRCVQRRMKRERIRAAASDASEGKQ